MEKKRSIGLTIFSLYLVFFGWLISSSMLNGIMKNMYTRTSFSLYKLCVIMETLGFIIMLISGIFIFLRKDWYRRLLIYTCSFMCLPVFYLMYYRTKFIAIDPQIEIMTGVIGAIMFYVFPIVRPCVMLCPRMLLGHEHRSQHPKGS